MQFSDQVFCIHQSYKDFYGSKKPYFVGVVLDVVFPMLRGDDWNIKIPVFQSPTSYGFVLIKAKTLELLPKIAARGQILIVKEAWGKVDFHYSKGTPEKVAFITSDVSKYRLVLTVSEHILFKTRYRTKDGDINYDKDTSITTNFERIPVDEKLDSFLVDLIENYKKYEEEKDYVEIDPLKYFALQSCLDFDKMMNSFYFPRDGGRQFELNLALIVAAWISDQDIVLELWDGSMEMISELYDREVTGKYTQVFRIKEYNKKIPTMFVKLGKNAKMKANFYVEPLRQSDPDDPTGQLINLRKVEMTDHLPIIRGTSDDRITRTVGFQGYNIFPRTFILTRYLCNKYRMKCVDVSRSEQLSQSPAENSTEESSPQKSNSQNK